MSAANIAFKLPEPEDLEERTDAVLRVVYLIFSEGCHATNGELSRESLVQEAIRLGRILCGLLPKNSEAKGLLALMLLSDSRRRARRGPDGRFVPLEFQNRQTWDRQRIDEGVTLTKEALTHGIAQRYALEAAISAVHAQAPDFESTDWPQIVALYDFLYQRHPNPVLRVNQAVALSYVQGPAAGLSLLSSVEAEPKLKKYQPFHACRADLFARLGRRAEAAEAYRQAIAFSNSRETADFLEERLSALGKI
jgi:RNA polymerase sigma-70 factor (ECF subfamily)